MLKILLSLNPQRLLNQKDVICILVHNNIIYESLTLPSLFQANITQHSTIQSNTSKDAFVVL
jgi:hypothetical protein